MPGFSFFLESSEQFLKVRIINSFMKVGVPKATCHFMPEMTVGVAALQHSL